MVTGENRRSTRKPGPDSSSTNTTPTPAEPIACRAGSNLAKVTKAIAPIPKTMAYSSRAVPDCRRNMVSH